MITHSFFFYYFLSDFSDYPSQTISPYPPTPTPQLPLHCNPVISGVATIKTSARKTQCSIFSFFRPFYKSTLLSMTWPEKKKKRILVRYLTDNAVDHSAIQVAATCQPATRQKSISRKTNLMTLRINNQNYGGKVYFQCTIIRR